MSKKGDRKDLYGVSRDKFFRGTLHADAEMQRRVQEEAGSIEPSTYDGYADIHDDAHMRRMLNSKREFIQCKPPLVATPSTKADVERLWSKTCNLDEYSLTPTQQFVRNFMSDTTPYNGLLLFHGVGVGKTCSAISIAERFPEKKVVVVCPQALKADFKRQIFDFSKLRENTAGLVNVSASSKQCTGSSYLKAIPNIHNVRIDVARSKIRSAILRRYRLYGYQEFAGKVLRMKGDVDLISRAFSNTVLIVDEAHHLRTLRDQKREVTDSLHRLLLSCDGVKLILLTATPMFNDTGDIIELVNLLLLNDKKLPLRFGDILDANGDLILPDGRKRLIETLRGYISHASGAQPYAFPRRLSPIAEAGRLPSNIIIMAKKDVPTLDLWGVRIPQNDIISTESLPLVVSPLSALQAELFDFLEKKNVLVGDSQGKTTADVDGEDEDIVYDESVFETLETNLTKKTQTLQSSETSSRSRKSVNSDTQNFRNPDIALQIGFALGNIAFPSHLLLPVSPSTALSPFNGKNGFTTCFDIVRQSPLQVRYKTDTEFLKGGELEKWAPKMRAILDISTSSQGVAFVYSRFLWSGLIPLAIALEHQGFRRSNGRNILQQHTGVLRRPSGVYCVLSADKTFAPDFEAEYAACVSAANKNGDVVRIVLASSKASEGLSLRYVRQVHIMEPWYHLNKVEQIVGRATRFCSSHAELPLEQRNVTVFLHAVRRAHPDAKKETLDLRAYRIAQSKQRRIDALESVLMHAALDCTLSRAASSKAVQGNKKGVVLSLGTSMGAVISAAIDARSPLPGAADWPVVRPTPESCLYDDAPPAEIDDATYSPLLHSNNQNLLVKIIAGVFLHDIEDARGRALEDIVAACREKLPEVQLSSIYTALASLLHPGSIHLPEQRVSGRLSHVSDRYFFHPDTLSGNRWTVVERRRAIAEMLRNDGVVHTRSGAASRNSEIEIARLASEQDWLSGSVEVTTPTPLPSWVSVRHRLGVLGTLLGQIDVANRERLLEAALDATLDRISFRTLLDIISDYATLYVSSVAKRNGSKDEERIAPEVALESLSRGGFVARLQDKSQISSASADTLYFAVTDVVDDGKIYIYTVVQKKKSDPPTTKLEQAFGSILDRAKRALDVELHRSSQLIAYLQVHSGVNGVFKIIDKGKRASTGSVCNQNSGVKMEHLRDEVMSCLPHNIRLVLSRHALWLKLGRRALCNIHEIALRAFASDQFARPPLARMAISDLFVRSTKK